MTIYSSGLRLNELLSLQVKDIDFDRGEERINCIKLRG